MTSVVRFTIMEIEIALREENMEVQDNTEKQNIVPEDGLSLFLRTGLQFLTGVYVFLILCVMPLYFTDGYAHIGRDKYAFFYQVTTRIGLLFVILLGVQWGRRILCRSRKNPHSGEDVCAMDNGSAASGESKVLSLTDKFALGYAVAVLLSYFFSPYREGGIYADAWYGTQGWYMGTCSQLLFVGIYFAVSRFWSVKVKWLAVCLPVTFGIFILGILNRFGVYPIPMRGAGPEFISTIGNINWYCSYLVLVLFAGMFYFCADAEMRKPVKTAMSIWLTAGFGALLTQGSLSGLFTLGIMLIVIYLCAVHSMQWAEAFVKCLVCLGGAATVIYVLRLFVGDYYNYSDAMADLVTNTPLALCALGFGLYTWYKLHSMHVQSKTCKKALVKIGYGVCGVAGLAIVVYLLLATLNTLRPGSLGALSGNELFTFDGAWGSNRGLSWAVGWNCFLEQDLWGKIVGMGPDTMVEYVSTGLESDLAAAVQEFFGNFKLTNAHNEWLTILVNEGICGLVMYVGLFISAIMRMAKKGLGKTGQAKPDRQNAGLADMGTGILAGACGMAVLAYVVNSMFGFQQVMGAGVLFVILGIGESCMRTE